MAERGFNELLQHQQMIEPGVMLLKSGAYLTGFLYQGPDVESMSNAEQEWQSAAYNNALKRLEDGWMVHQIIVRSQSSHYPSGDFDEPTNHIIDAEREEQFTEEGSHFETFPFIFLTYLPPKHEQSGMMKKIGDFLMGRSQADIIDHVERDVRHVNEVLRNFEMSFSQTMRFRRLGTSSAEEREHDELLHALNMVINHENRPCCLPNPPSSLDTWLARELENGEHFIYDDKYVLVLSVDGLPPESYPNMLSEVEHLPIPLEWSSRFIICDDHYSRDIIKSMRAKWDQKTQPFLAKMMNKTDGRVDQYAVSMVQESDDNAALVEQGAVFFGHYTSTIILRGGDANQVKRMASDVMKAFERKGFKLRVESRNALEAFLGSFPGHGRENVRKPFFHTLNFADMTPNSTDWPGSETCPCPEPNFPEGSPALIQAASTGTTPFRLNLHVDDVGHTLILGPTGAGKSTLLCLIASQFDRYPNSQIFVFDKGLSMFPLTKACKKAVHYDLGKIGDTIGGLCPLAELDTDEDRGWACDYLDTLMRIQLERNNADMISAHDRNLLREAVNNIAGSTTLPEQRTITHFIANVQSNAVRTLLQYYRIGEGAGGTYLDGTANDIQYQDFVTFEIQDLMNYGTEILIPVLLFLFRQIEKRLTGRPSLLIIDEAWLALDTPVFAERIKEWLKVFRKSNCSVVLATQSVADVANSSITGALVESCPTKIFLPNPEAKNENQARLYSQVFGLNEKQIEIIANAVRKRQYYYISPAGKRLFELNLGPVALSFVGAGAKEDIARVRELESAYGELWPAYWILDRVEDRRYAEAWLADYNAVNGTDIRLLSAA